VPGTTRGGLQGGWRADRVITRHVLTAFKVECALRLFLEKLTVAQLVKRAPHFMFQDRSPHGPILSPMNAPHYFTSSSF
jgi:hypothetical protein